MLSVLKVIPLRPGGLCGVRVSAGKTIQFLATGAMSPLRPWASVKLQFADLCGWGLDVGELSTCFIICLLV